MKYNQTKSLAYGAMMIAIFAIMIAIATYVPVINFIATFFAVLPIAWYSANFERKSSIYVGLIGCMVTFLFGGLIILPFSLIFASAGVVIGDALRLKKSKLFLLMSTGITVLITFAIQYVISLKLLETDFIKESMSYMRESYERANEITESITGKTAIEADMLDLMFNMIETVIPALITISLFSFTFVVVSLNLPLLKRFGVNVPKFNAFKNMRMPKAVLWYYLIILVIDLFIRPEAGTVLYVICFNFSVVLWLLLTLQGVSLAHYFLDMYGTPKILKVLVSIMAIPFYSIYVMIGIIDLGFDIRRFVKGNIQK